jgi:uncharacterized protein with FMN-binding domain
MNLPAHRKMLSAAAAASVLLLTAACGGGDDESTSSPSSSSAAPAEESESAPAESAGSYADGDYTAEGSYSNPGGTSSVSVALTLDGGTVTELEVTPEAQGTSRQFQEKFVSGINAEVVGKSLDEVKVSKVSGSSLTSEGFNAALDEIKADAGA